MPLYLTSLSIYHGRPGDGRGRLGVTAHSSVETSAQSGTAISRGSKMAGCIKRRIKKKKLKMPPLCCLSKVVDLCTGAIFYCTSNAGEKWEPKVGKENDGCREMENSDCVLLPLV